MNQRPLQVEIGALRHSGSGTFDPDADIPTPAGVGGELPRFRLAILRDRAGKPQIVIAAEDGQFTAFEFRGPLEIGERDKVQVLFERPVFRCFWEAGVTESTNFRQVATIVSQ